MYLQAEIQSLPLDEHSNELAAPKGGGVSHDLVSLIESESHKHRVICQWDGPVAWGFR